MSQHFSAYQIIALCSPLPDQLIDYFTDHQLAVFFKKKGRASVGFESPLAQGPAKPCALVLNLHVQVESGGLVSPWPKPIVSLTGSQIPYTWCWLRTTVASPTKQGRTYIYHDQKFLTMLLMSGCYTSVFRCNSFNCFGSAGEGASAITSRAAWFFGNAITSRMLGSPAKIIHNRSIPGAIPP